MLYRKDLIQRDFFTDLLAAKFGDHIFHIGNFFPMKSYYQKEMGQEDQLERLIIFFYKNQFNGSPIDLKLWTMEEEKKSKKDGGRVFNLDPGILGLENMQLLTSKPYAHRIHLGKGIYSDLTYTFKDNSFVQLPWTYPDYASEELISFFNYSRNLFKTVLTQS